ncbi:DMT family transporter [Pseudomonas sp. CFBP 13711]|uniref:DMT family transporter n=1 Tax=unclassified Pseudomonas TaxID=196821 RepID=UPI00177A99EC|nr:MULTISPECIES: DMT family transporter [unclassified Pseudomonas]MBD8706039.1 DMT family transporter [Pseudomonas sp. CFBP 13711]MBD8711937.1 DMT family transporter [Pseudomonas sp. CFBP 13715]
MSYRTLWSIALFAVTAVWGWSFVAKHETLAIMAASTLNAWMFSLAALALLPFSIRSFRYLKPREWVGAVVAGTVLFAAFSMQTSGAALTTPSNAGFITGLCTVFTPLFVYLIGGGRPSPRQAGGTAIAVVGLGLLSLDGFALHYGDLLILGCAACFAVHIVIISTFTTPAVSMASASVQLAIVGLLSMAWSLASNQFSLPSSLPTTVTILLLALFATALAYAIQNHAQAVLAPEKVALILICEPLFSGFFGYCLAGDRLPPERLAGAVLILLGLAVTELRIASTVHAPRRRS